MADYTDRTAQASSLLFTTLAEQVKLPFVAIAHAAELSRMNPGQDELERLFKTISITSEAALKLIDGYLLSVQLQHEPTLALEPVSLGSVLYDTAHRLDKYAKAHDCTVELRVEGKYGPVMARQEVIETAMESLGYSFIEAASNQGSRTKVILMVRRTRQGMSTGVFSDTDRLSGTLFKQAKVLKGVARQPLGNFSAGSGAGVFVADALFAWLDSPMRVARFKAMQGLAATLIPSRQLSLV